MPKVYLSASDRQKAEEERACMDIMTAIQIAVNVPGQATTKQSISDATGIPLGTLKNRFNDPMGFNARELRKLRAAGVPADAMLSFLGYKQERKKESSVGDIADLLRQAITQIIEEREV